MKNIAITLAVVLSVVVASAVGVISYLMGSRSESAASTTTNASAASATSPAAVSVNTPAATPTAAPTVTPTSKAPAPEASTKTVYLKSKTQAPARVTLASLGSKPCATLFARGVGYQRMWNYYEEFGYPDSMDVDHDGYPCETVYGDAN